MSESPSSLHTQHLARLLAGLREGDRSAAEELVRRAGQRLERLARQMLRRFPVVRAQEQTADVLQEATLRLLAALRDVTPIGTCAFYSLASRQVRFHLLDLARRYRRGAPQPLDEHPPPVAPGTGPGDVDDLERWAALHELDAQGKYAEAQPLLQKALAIFRKVEGEEPPDAAISHGNLASNLHSQGKHAEAAKHWRAALLGHEAARLSSADSGFDRSRFRAGIRSPRAGLAACLARLGQAREAWQHAEAALARGLLDDLVPASPEGGQSPDARPARLRQLDELLLPLATREQLSQDEKARRDLLNEERRRLLAALAKDAGDRAAARVFPLARIQKQVPADAALVLWLDAGPSIGRAWCVGRANPLGSDWQGRGRAGPGPTPIRAWRGRRMPRCSRRRRPPTSRGCWRRWRSRGWRPWRPT